MSIKQITTFISTDIQPLIYYDSSGNKHLKIDASGNLMYPINDINDQLNAVIASLPSGATYLNHTLTIYTFNTPPVLLFTIFYTI